MAELTISSHQLSAPTGMKSFILIWLGQLISLLGSGLTSFALGVYIFQQTGQATAFAISILCGTLPFILLLPITGSLADRWNRRRIMILADCGAALATVSVLGILLIGDLQLWHIYLVSLLSSFCSAFQEPAYAASITMLVPKQDLTRANGMVQTGQALQSVLTPLLAGGLFVAIGLKGIILIDFATFFFAIGALLLVKIPQPEKHLEENVPGKRSFWRDTAFGWQYLSTRRGLLGLLWYFALINFLLSFSSVLVTPMVLARESPEVLGMVNTVLGLGMLLGGLTISIWGGPKRARRIPLVIGLTAPAMLGLAITGLHPHPLVIAAGMFLLLFCIPIASGLNRAVWQVKIAPEVQGRVLGIRAMVTHSMMPLAFLSAGPIADRLFEPWMQVGGALAQTWVGALLQTGPGRGIGLLLVLSGLVGILATLTVFSNMHIRNVEDELPDAIQ